MNVDEESLAALFGRMVNGDIYNSEQNSAAQSDVDYVAQYSPKRIANSVKEVKTVASDFLNKEITNDNIGLSAIVSRSNLEKMTSESAVKKSVSPRIHFLAVANVDSLFKLAETEYTHKDRYNDVNIKLIHRVFVPFVVDKEVYSVKMTVKELAHKGEGNRIYSLEAVEIKNASRDWNASYISEDGVQTSFPQEAFIKSISQLKDKINTLRTQFVSVNQASRVPETKAKVQQAEEMYANGATDSDVWNKTGCIRR